MSGDAPRRGGDRAQKQDDRRRSVAEWTTLTISLSIVLSLVALLTYDYFATRVRPVTIAVTPRLDRLRQAGDSYYLPVAVTNRGDPVAEDVQVTVMLSRAGGAAESAQFTIRFLTGGETAEAVVVFHQDPTQGSITFAISFLQS